MIERTVDAEFINAIVNHPAVKPDLGYPDDIGYLDTAPHMADGFIWLRKGEGALMLFHRTGPEFMRIYEKHNLFLVRGREAIDTGREMLAYALSEFASVIWTQTPFVNRKARWFNRQIGFMSKGVGTTDMLGAVEYFGSSACH